MYETTKNKRYSEANNIQSDSAVAGISVMCARYTGGVLVGEKTTTKKNNNGKNNQPKPPRNPVP